MGTVIYEDLNAESFNEWDEKIDETFLSLEHDCYTQFETDDIEERTHSVDVFMHQHWGGRGYYLYDRGTKLKLIWYREIWK
jgi:hypothetical protein